MMDNYKPSRPGMVQPKSEQKVFTAEMLKNMKEAPSDPEGVPAAASAPKPAKKPVAPKKFAGGGKIDGCCQRGKTRGRIV